jgi:hypothetical protein
MPVPDLGPLWSELCDTLDALTTERRRRQHLEQQLRDTDAVLASALALARGKGRPFTTQQRRDLVQSIVDARAAIATVGEADAVEGTG